MGKKQESKPKSKGGRPSKYSPELVDEICERLSKGEPLAQICRDPHMAHPSTVRDWMAANESVSRQIARAREDGEDYIAAECLAIIDTPPARVATMHGDAVDSGDVANRKLRAEYRLKLLAKWNPKKWGEKVEVDNKGEMNHSITITRRVIGA